MPTTEITSAADVVGRRIIMSELNSAGNLRLLIESEERPYLAAIWLDVQARRELIAALTASLPEADYIAWRREMGVPVPGDLEVNPADQADLVERITDLEQAVADLKAARP